MKTELFKKSFEKYQTSFYRPYTVISEFFGKKNDTFNEDFFESFYKDLSHYQKYPYFFQEKTETEKDIFLENYANPMCSVSKSYSMIVVERSDDKVSIKLFSGYKIRQQGKVWFKTSKNVRYISVNTKTGCVYYGSILDFQKKKKCVKSIKRNVFYEDPINILRIFAKNEFTTYQDNSDAVIIDAISTFIDEIDGKFGLETLTYSQRLFKFYLDKKQIKYPNNFSCYATILFGPEIRKILKKNDKRLVESYMINQKISGKKLRMALHTCNNINIGLYNYAKDMFGSDWLNQDGDVVLSLLNSIIAPNTYLCSELKEMVTNEELKRIYSIFKKVYIDKEIDSYSFQDHIRMYVDLKTLGESNLKWESDEQGNKFRNEHLDWTDKIQFYKKGTYQIIYSDFFINKIKSTDDNYEFVLLKNSAEYNEESRTQSNCVKTYVDKCGSIIVSVRNRNNDSRATIEYRLEKPKDKIEVVRKQSLGKFNTKLGEEWNDILFNLDDIILSSVNDENFGTIKIKKEYSNGVVVELDSVWFEKNLMWENNKISNVLFYGDF